MLKNSVNITRLNSYMYNGVVLIIYPCMFFLTYWPVLVDDMPLDVLYKLASYMISAAIYVM